MHIKIYITPCKYCTLCPQDTNYIKKVVQTDNEKDDKQLPSVPLTPRVRWVGSGHEAHWTKFGVGEAKLQVEQVCQGSANEDTFENKSEVR